MASVSSQILEATSSDNFNAYEAQMEIQRLREERRRLVEKFAFEKQSLQEKLAAEAAAEEAALATRNELISLLPGVAHSLLEPIPKGRFIVRDIYKLRARWTKDEETVPGAYGNNKDIWLEGFLNYQSALGFFFASTNPRLLSHTFNFLQQILRLARICKCHSVLRLALFHHEMVMGIGQCEPEA